MAADEGPRKIRLFCPPLSKMVKWVAWDEQRLDLGSIAGAFGLEPSTVKLNGHFISRGIDLVASCVTWRSLLSFFYAKGLSTGEDDGDALIVDGKLSKLGGKRAHYPQETSGDSHPGDDLCLIRNKKLKDQNSGCEGEPPVSRYNGLGLKIKQPETINSCKKLKLKNITRLGRSEVVETKKGISSSTSTVPFKCGFLNNNLKRTREDEPYATASRKRIR